MGALAATSPRPALAPRVVAAALASLLASVAAVVLVGAPDRRSPPPSPDAVLALARPPYLGVACPRPNRIGCGRVGLHVALRAPLERMQARIAGHPVALADVGHGPSRAKGLTFEGFIERRGFISRVLGVRADAASGRWLGSDAPRIAVRLMGRTADGRAVTRTLRVRLAAGYG